MRIDSYDFGKIQIEGKEYREDLVIYSNSIFSPWWRKQGHYFSIEDLPSDLFAQKPDVVIIGTGYSGLMEVSEKMIDYFKEQGIEVVIDPTKTACKKYNQLSQEKKVIALFHLTC